jgi:hypothetical protein
MTVYFRVHHQKINQLMDSVGYSDREEVQRMLDKDKHLLQVRMSNNRWST